MKKKIMISIDDEFLSQIDARRKEEHMTRSGYITFCINREIKKHKGTTMINDISNALNILEEYAEDLQDDYKKKVKDMLLEKAETFS